MKKTYVRLALLVLLSLPGLAQSEPALITVSGQAEVMVVPDRIQIEMQAVTRHRDAQAAERANATAVQKILSVSRAFDIKTDDVQTANLELSEETDEKTKKLTGYLGSPLNHTVLEGAG